MIKNERQYRITKAQVAKFEAALKTLTGQPPAKSVDPILAQAQISAIRSQCDSLHSQLDEYESLRSGTITRLSAQTFGELPSALIKARIAAGMSQKDLARHLGLKEQQVQKYEATDYSSASFSRISSVIQVLGVSVKEEVTLAKRH